MTEIEMVSLVVKAALTNKVNGTRNEANFDFTELVYLKNVGNKWKVFFSACLRELLLQIWQIIAFFCLEWSLWVSLGGQLVNISECVFLEK